MEAKGQIAGIALVFFGVMGAGFLAYDAVTRPLHIDIFTLLNGFMAAGYILSGIGTVMGNDTAYFAAIALVTISLLMDVFTLSFIGLLIDAALLSALVKGLIASL